LAKEFKVNVVPARRTVMCHQNYTEAKIGILGYLFVQHGKIIVLPQGFRFSIDLLDGPCCGYVSEIFGTHFCLPDLGPIVSFS
jgi:homogentisate 1,2-dioxygenase